MSSALAAASGPLRQFIDQPDFRFDFDRSRMDAFSKVQLTPYNTGKKDTLAHPAAYTWYDELIVSREPIAPPGAPTPPVASQPAPPAGPTIGAVRQEAWRPGLR